MTTGKELSMFFTLAILKFAILFVLRFTEGSRPLIYVGDRRLHPVDWTKDSIKLIINNEYVNFPRSDFGLEDLDAVIQGYYFLTWKENTLVTGFKKSFSTYQLYSKHRFVTKFPEASIYFPIENEQAFWQFGQALEFSDAVQTITFAVKRSVNHTLVDKAVEWKLNIPAGFTLFTRGELVYSRFVYFSVMLKRKSGKFDHYFARVNNDDASENPKIVPIAEELLEGFFLQNINNRTKIYAHRHQLLSSLMEELDSFISSLPAKAPDEYQYSECYDFAQKLVGKFDTCTGNSIIFRNSRPPFQVMNEIKSSWPLVSVTYIGGGINREIFMFKNFDGGFKVSICNPDCINHSRKFQGELDSSWVGIDTVSGHMIAPIKLGHNKYERVAIPLFYCANLTDCPSCEMIGFYHKCEWVNGKCIEGNKTVESTNVCFKISGVDFDQNKTTLKILSNYDFNDTYDMFWLNIDNQRKEASYLIAGIFQTSWNKQYHSIELFIKRKTGSYMKATFGTIKSSEGSKNFPWLGLVIILLLFALILTLIATAIIHQKRTQNLQSRTSMIGLMLRPFASSQHSLLGTVRSRRKIHWSADRSRGSTISKRSKSQAMGFASRSTAGQAFGTVSSSRLPIGTNESFSQKSHTVSTLP